MTKDVPKISVIIPSYNQVEFIEETILSILNQEYTSLELIIMDGGSTDKSVEVIKKYEDRIAHWVSESDNGQTHAINKGFRVATGDLVCWMNSDDIFLPEAFKQISEAYLKTSGSYEVYFGDKSNIDKAGNTIKTYFYPPFCGWGIKYTTNMNISNQACFWKPSLFEKVGYLDESIQFAMDYEWFLRIYLHGAKFKKINGVLGALRMYDENKSSLEEWIKIKFENLHTIKENNYIGYSPIKKALFDAYKAFFVGPRIIRSIFK